MISTLDPHWGSLEKVTQLPDPDHPYFALTKVSGHSKNPYLQH